MICCDKKIHKNSKTSRQNHINEDEYKKYPALQLKKSKLATERFQLKTRFVRYHEITVTWSMTQSREHEVEAQYNTGGSE